MVSKIISDKYNIPTPIVTLLYGMLIGKHGFKLFVPHYIFSKDIISMASRIVLCLQTMVVSLSLPKRYIFTNGKSIVNLVIVIGALKCLLTFIILKVFTFLDNSTCWATAASLTPTDPILSSSIIKGKFARQHVPEKLQLLLTAESGINDGFGILMLSISLDILKSPSIAPGLYNFFVYSLGNKVILSGILGYFIGRAIQFIYKTTFKHGIVSSEIIGIQTFCLCFLAMALMEFIDGSELICIFFIGIGLNEDEWYTADGSSNRIAEIVESTFCKVLFIFIGTIIDFKRFTLRMIFVCATIILVRRPLILLFSHKTIPLLQNIKEALFVGWFGPVGVGALYYCLLYDKKADTLTIDYGICTVFLSVFIHGLSVPLYKLFRRIARQDVSAIEI
ncbi:Na+/H+ antiporter [Glugoides intestinalis]